MFGRKKKPTEHEARQALADAIAAAVADARRNGVPESDRIRHCLGRWANQTTY